jgi:hypothetical protein
MVRRFTTLAIFVLCMGIGASEAQEAARAHRVRPFPPSLKIEGQPNELRPPSSPARRERRIARRFRFRP